MCRRTIARYRLGMPYISRGFVDVCPYCPTFTMLIQLAMSDTKKGVGNFFLSGKCFFHSTQLYT